MDLRHCLVAGSNLGALVKSASTLKLTGTLLYRNRTALRREAREVLYAGTARLESDAVFSVRNERTLEDRGDKPAEIARMHLKIPADRSLDRLLHGVLEQTSWEEALAWLDGSVAGD